MRSQSIAVRQGFRAPSRQPPPPANRYSRAAAVKPANKEARLRFYVLLRWIIVVVAVLAAVPVVLWTITALVRAYFGPLKAPTFPHQVQVTAPPEATGSGDTNAGAQAQSAVQTGLPPHSPTATVEEKAKPADTRDQPVAPAADANMPTGTTSVTTLLRTGDAAAAPATAGQGATSGNASTASPAQTTATDSSLPPPGTSLVSGSPTAPQQPAAAEPLAEAAPAAAPLKGPVPLPRRRPSEIVLVQITPANVPMPRPRPDGAGAATTEGSPDTGPLNFLQNIFH